MPDDSPLSQNTPAAERWERSTPRDSPPTTFESPDTGPSVTDGTPRDIEESLSGKKSRRGNGKIITRKSHNKSRLGCLSCKKRRIKVCLKSSKSFPLRNVVDLGHHVQLHICV